MYLQYLSIYLYIYSIYLICGRDKQLSGTFLYNKKASHCIDRGFRCTRKYQEASLLLHGSKFWLLQSAFTPLFISLSHCFCPAPPRLLQSHIFFAIFWTCWVLVHFPEHVSQLELCCMTWESDREKPSGAWMGMWAASYMVYLSLAQLTSTQPLNAHLSSHHITGNGRGSKWRNEWPGSGHVLPLQTKKALNIILAINPNLKMSVN